MTQINQNFRNIKYPTPQTTFKSNPEMVQQLPTEAQAEVQVPDIYYMPDGNNQPKSFKETVKQMDMMNVVYPWLEHSLLMLGTCSGLAIGVDKFTNACGGSYEKSLVGKAAVLGDKIQNSKIIQSNPVQKFIGWCKSGAGKFDYTLRNCDVYNAIKNTPSLPEWTIVKDEMLKQEQRIVHDFNHIVKELHLNDNGLPKLSDLGLDKAEKDFLKKHFNVSNISKIDPKEAVNTVLLKRLGKNSSEISSIVAQGSDSVKKELLNTLGLTIDDLTEISKDNTGKYIDKVKQACKNGAGKIWIGAGEMSWLGPFQPFKRKIGCDVIYNRLHSLKTAIKGGGAKTETGVFFSKMLQKLHRGFTFGGGKMGVLFFVSPHLVETMINTTKADPDAKVGTAVNGFANAVSWAFTFPLGLKIMHSLAGAQYAGMSKDAVEKIRKLTDDFNADVKGDRFKNNKALYESEYRRVSNEIKNLKKVEGQTLLTKICRKLGSFVTLDLERLKSYRKGNSGMNILRRLPSIGRNALGVPMRLGIWSLITMGVLDAAIVGGLKKVFGNFYDPFKEDERKENKKQQKEFLKQDLRERMVEAQREKQLKLTQGESTVNNEIPAQEIPRPNLIERIKPQETQLEKVSSAISGMANNNGVENKTEKTAENIAKDLKQETPAVQEVIPEVQKVEEKYIPNQAPNPELFNKKENKIDNYTYIPSSENLFNKGFDTPVNKYIPSQTAANFTKTFDNSGLQGALRRADRAEQRALQVLAGKFSGV